MTENRRTGDEHIGTGGGDLRDIVDFDAAVHFQTNVVAAVIDAPARFAQLIERAGNKGLAAEARIDRHDQDHVELIHHIIEIAQRRRRVKHQARFAAVLFDQLQRTVDVLARFGMKSDIAGACFGEVRDQRIDRLDHQMHVNRRGNAVVAQRFQHHRPHRQIGNIVIVHHVEMHHVAAGG